MKTMGIWVLVVALAVILLVGCTGKSGKMPFNGEVTFHDMNVTIPSSFIRDSTQSKEDVWVFERDNYKSYIMLIHGALEMQGGMSTPEKYSESLRSTGATSEVKSFNGYPCVYTTSVANNGMYATETVFFVGDTSYALTMCTANEADMAEYQTVYDSLSFSGVAPGGSSPNSSAKNNGGNVKTGAKPEEGSPDEDEEPLSDEDKSAPVSDADGVALYEDVLDEVCEAFREGYDHDREYRYVFSGMMERIMYDAQNDAYDKVGYRIEDISGDGVPDLLIGENIDVTGSGKPFCQIYGCYTVKNGKVAVAFEGYTRSSYSWIGNSRFAYWGSGGVGNAFVGDAHLSRDGTEVIWEDFYFSENAEVNGGFETKFYYNTTGFADASGSMEISEDEFDEITDKYMNDDRVKTLELTPLSEYGGAKTTGSSGGNGNASLGEGPFELFGGQYQNFNAGVVANIWEQSTGIVFAFDIEDASFQGDTSYDDVRGRLGFYAVDHTTDDVVTGYVETEEDGIRVTFTGSDSGLISEGDVYTLDKVEY